MEFDLARPTYEYIIQGSSTELLRKSTNFWVCGLVRIIRNWNIAFDGL